MKRENNYSRECLGLLNTAVLVKASEMLRKELRAGRTSPSLYRLDKILAAAQGETHLLAHRRSLKQGPPESIMPCSLRWLQKG